MQCEGVNVIVYLHMLCLSLFQETRAPAKTDRKFKSSPSSFHQQVAIYIHVCIHLHHALSRQSESYLCPGQSWAAVSTEGLLVYSRDTGLVFDPCDLSQEVTPDGVTKAISDHKFSAALMMSFQLNEAELITKAVECVPLRDGEYITGIRLRVQRSGCRIHIGRILRLACTLTSEHQRPGTQGFEIRKTLQRMRSQSSVEVQYCCSGISE